MSEPTTVPAPTADPPPLLDEAAPILPLMRLLPAPPAGTILAPPELPEPASRRSFFGHLWSEARLAVRMYVDPRYRISRTAQIAFPLVAALLVVNYFLFGWLAIPVVSPVAERLLDAALVVLAYRVLVRELDRYRAVLDYLARFRQ